MKELDKLVEGWRADGIRLNGGADKPYTDDENSIRAFVLEHCADELEAALKQSAVGERVEPARYFADGPQGHFFADDLQLARDLVNLYDKQDDWTITDLQNPTGEYSPKIDSQKSGEGECIHQYKSRNDKFPGWYDEGTGPTPDAWHHDCVQPDHIWRTVYTAPNPDSAAHDGGEGAVGLPINGVYLIRYDDNDVSDEVFAGICAREASRHRFDQIGLNWNAHLFVRIDHNCKQDDNYPDAITTPIADASKPEPNGKPAECANGCLPLQVCDYCQDVPVWRREWQGSGPQRGFHIRTGTRLHNAPILTYLGDQISGDAVDALIAAHNDAVQRDATPKSPDQTTQVDVEQTARELLAAEYERDGYAETAYAVKSGWKAPDAEPALRAITAALSATPEPQRQTQGEQLCSDCPPRDESDDCRCLECPRREVEPSTQPPHQDRGEVWPLDRCLEHPRELGYVDIDGFKRWVALNPGAVSQLIISLFNELPLDTIRPAVIAALTEAKQQVKADPLAERMTMFAHSLRVESKCSPSGYTFGEQAVLNRLAVIADELDRAIHEVRVLGKSHATTSEEAKIVADSRRAAVQLQKRAQQVNAFNDAFSDYFRVRMFVKPYLSAQLDEAVAAGIAAALSATPEPQRQTQGEQLCSDCPPRDESDDCRCLECPRREVEPSTQPPHQDRGEVEAAQSAMTFYGVSTIEGLVRAQAEHIERLQAKVPPTSGRAFTRVREG